MNALPPIALESVAMLRELAHRLRTPLATIHGYASLLEEHVVESSDAARMADWPRRIQQEVERATDLLTDLSRIRVVSAEGVRAEPTELRGVVEAALARVEEDTERTVSLRGGPPVPYQGDPLLLQRAAYHLATLGLQCGREATLSVSRGDEGAVLAVDWAPPGAPAPPQDPWLLFCRVVAHGHGGALEERPGRLSLTLRAARGAPR